MHQNEDEYLDKYCVECTIHKKGGKVHEDYEHALFLVISVAKYAVWSQTNLVISLLQYTNKSDASQSQTNPPSLSQSQPAQLLPSQLELSQNSLNQNGVHLPQFPSLPPWNGMNMNLSQQLGMAGMFTQRHNGMYTQQPQLDNPAPVGFGFSRDTADL
jgi:hypothetical protein